MTPRRSSKAQASSFDWRWALAVGVILTGTAIRLILAARIPLVPDEAYYWTWSRRLAGGYFDHPPMVALLIAAGTTLFRVTSAASPLATFAVRFGNILAGSVAGLATAALAARLVTAKMRGGVALFAAIVMTVMPLAAAGLVVATPDAPVLAFFALALYCVVRAIEHPARSSHSMRWWLLTGVILGFAFLSKYTSIFLPFGVLIAFAAIKPLRTRLADPGPYVACVIATLLFLPVLFWNETHHWISFRFQLQHGLGAAAMTTAERLRGALHHEGDLAGGQAGLVSPVLFVMMAVAVFGSLRTKIDPAKRLIAIVSLVSFGFFVYSAIQKSVEANWPAPAYIGAVALLCTRDWGIGARRAITAGVAIAGVLTGIIYIHALAPIIPIPPTKDPIGKGYGWDSLSAAAVRAARAPGPSSGKTAWIAADRYQDAAELTFHGAPAIDAFSLNLSGRANQYDLWPGFPQRAAVDDRLVIVLDETPDVHPVVAMLAPFFQSVLRGELVEMKRGDVVVGERRVYSLDGWLGGWPPRTQ